MAVEALTFPDPPTETDLEDGGQAYNMGIRFSLGEAGPCPGIEWRVPDSVSTPPGGTHVASLWLVDTGARVAAVDFDPSAAVGTKLQIPFAEPIDLAAATEYVAAVYTVHYVFTTGTGNLPATSPSGNITGDQGRLATWAGGGNPGTYPGDPFNAVYHVSPLIGTFDDEEHITAGTAALTLGASVAVSTRRPHAASAALSLTSAALASTRRISAASAPLALSASAPVSTSRETAGSARLLLSARTTTAFVGAGPLLRTATRPELLTSASRSGGPRIVTSTTAAR